MNMQYQQPHESLQRYTLRLLKTPGEEAQRELSLIANTYRGRNLIEDLSTCSTIIEDRRHVA